MTDEVRMDQPTPEAVLEDMRKQDSDEMSFRITREPGKREPGKTFSAEALADLNQTIGLFVGARLMRHWEDKGLDDVGPSEMRVEVKVHVDGVSRTVTADLRPWYLLDGTYREEAIR